MKYEFKGTPAPWAWDGKVWDYDPQSESPWLLNIEHKQILTGEIKCISEANAHIIAASPDLLNACIKLVEWCAKYPDEIAITDDTIYEIGEIAKTAIHKALNIKQ